MGRIDRVHHERDRVGEERAVPVLRRTVNVCHPRKVRERLAGGQSDGGPGPLSIWVL